MSHRNKGLTLLEILVVITILSILVVSLYTVFKSGVDAWSKSDMRLDIFQNARVVLDQFSRELPGAFVASDPALTGVDGDADPEVDGGPDTLEFVTSFGGEIYKLYYWLDEANDTLMREYIENPTDYTSDDYVESIDFGFKISDINFFYWDTNTGDWTSDGEYSEAALPKAVKIEITMKEDPNDNDAQAHQFETIVYLPNSEIGD